MIYSDKIYIPQDCPDEEIIWGNIDTVNSLFTIYVNEDEICQEALCSYYVDYYLAQVNNGGFSQFIYNSQNNQQIQDYITQGLKEMNAQGHLELWQRALDNLHQLDDVHLEQFLMGEYFGEDNPQREFLNQFDHLFFELNNNEDLFEINHQWLSKHEKLTRISDQDFIELLEDIQKRIPDWHEREQLAYENRPQYEKLIEALCEKAGVNLESINAGDPMFEYEDESHVAWYFSTDKGVFYMLELADRAIMFDAETQTKVVELELN